MSNYYFTLTNNVNKIVSRQCGLLEDTSIQHLLSTWNTILPQAACLKVSCISTAPKLRYFMERGKV